MKGLGESLKFQMIEQTTGSHYGVISLVLATVPPKMHSFCPHFSIVSSPIQKVETKFKMKDSAQMKSNLTF